MCKTLPVPYLTDSDIKRFWSKVAITANPDLCWVWTTKTMDKDGYGRIRIIVNGNAKMLRANRVSYFLGKKENPNELLVCHTCDNPKCCNPNHLFLGTVKDNTQDSIKKGRWPIGENHWTINNPTTLAKGNRNGHSTKPEATPKGENHWKSKLTTAQIIEIKKRYNQEKITQTQLGVIYNVSQAQIGRIVNNDTWKHLK